MNNQPTRFSQAQVLIAALFAVVMTGKMPAEPKTKASRVPAPSNKIRIRRSEFGSGGRYEGVFAEVARECGLSRSYVCQVKNGLEKSARVTKALRLAMQRRDSQPHVPPPRLTRRQAEQLRKDKRYQGLRIQVARDLNVSKNMVYSVVLGNAHSERVTNALLAAMAKRDAELGAKQVAE